MPEDLTSNLAKLQDPEKGDPETYQAINFFSKGLEGFDISENPNRLVRDDIIQGCIQRACEKHGWPIILAYDCDPDQPKTWEAEICNGKENGLLGSSKGCDSPAGAILAAYLAAIKKANAIGVKT
jgi:hypothetical protein